MSDEANAASNAVSEVTTVAETTVAAPETVTAPADVPKTARESLERQYDKAFEGEEKPMGDGRVRNPDGTFAPKAKAEAAPAEAAKVIEAAAAGKARAYPSRFAKEHNALWGNVPEPLQAEVERAIAEMQAGIDKYKPYERYASIDKFDQMAKQGGTTLEAALENYTGMENLLRRDLGAGIRQIAQNLGIDPAKIIEVLGGQGATQPAQGDTAEVSVLKAQLAEANKKVDSLSQKFSGFEQSLTQRELQAEIDAFKKNPNNPYFDALSPLMAQLLGGEHPEYTAKNLASAYQMAVRLTPEIAAKIEADKAVKANGGAQPPAAQNQTKPTETAQTGKAKLSITGSPAGSDPAKRQPPKTARDALERAAAEVGLS